MPEQPSLGDGLAGEAARGEAAPAQPPPRREPVSETAAMWISLGGTLGAWTTVVAGAVLAERNHTWAAPLLIVGMGGTLLAPSAGSWYAHAGPSRGLVLRAAGIGVEVVAGLEAARCEDECSDGGGALIEGIAIAGLALYAAGTLDDILTAPREARRYNQRIQGVAVVPMLRRDGAGVALAARF